MAKPKQKERHRVAKSQESSSVEAQKSQSIQRTKVEKRQARHDALLNSIRHSLILTDFSELHSKKKKAIRKRPKKKLKVNLSSLGASLDDIISQDKEKRAKKLEVSAPPKGMELRTELERVKAVMQHPEFKKNPLKALQQHIANTWEKKEGMS
jgi:Ribosome biogenesis protein SLX9